MIILELPKDFALDNTGRGVADTCERKYLLQIHLSYKSEKGSPALRYGSCFHALKEGYYSHVKKHGWTRDGEAIKQAIEYGRKCWEVETKKQIFDETDYRTFALCVECFMECLAEFNSDEGFLKVIDTERVFDYEVDIPPLSQFKYPALHSVKLRHTGRLDLQANLSGLDWLWEFKTTGQSVDTQVERLNRNAQIMGYDWAARQVLDFTPEGSFVVIHQATARRKKDGSWGAVTRNYRRSPQIFTPEDLEGWFDSYLSTAEKIVRCYEFGSWPMRHDSCYSYGRCSYCSVCEQNLPLERIIAEPPTGFIVQKWDIRTTSNYGG